MPRLVDLPQPGEAGGDHRMLHYLLGQQTPQHALPPRVLWMAERDGNAVDVGAAEARPFYRCHGASDLNPHWMAWSDIAGVLDSQDE